MLELKRKDPNKAAALFSQCCSKSTAKLTSEPSLAYTASSTKNRPVSVLHPRPVPSIDSAFSAANGNRRAAVYSVPAVSGSRFPAAKSRYHQ
jgi:hypothetical protein